MPTPARTSLDEIVRAGRALLASQGLTALTMQAVADRVGVRAPSLYKRVRSRDDLVRLIATAAADELGAQLDAIVARRDETPDAADDPDAQTQLMMLARRVRDFAHARPDEYRLVFAPASEAIGPEREALARAVAALLQVTTELAGPDAALDAARTVTAWATGFIGMELAGAFRLGGDVDRAYEFGVTRIAAALAG